MSTISQEEINILLSHADGFNNISKPMINEDIKDIPQQQFTIKKHTTIEGNITKMRPDYRFECGHCGNLTDNILYLHNGNRKVLIYCKPCNFYWDYPKNKV